VALAPDPSMSPLVVLAHDDPGTADSLRHAVQAATGWQVVMADPSPAGLTAALATGPSVALVGCAALASLPADCRTPIVAIGDDDRAADVRAALAAGARSLLAWPDGVADLPGELARVALTGQPASAVGHAGQPGSTAGHAGLVIATRGVQGGAGTTTVAIHLAAAWARWGPTPVLLLDLAGGLAFRLDLGTVPTWSSFTPAGGSAVGAADGSAVDAVDPFQRSAPGQPASAVDPVPRSVPEPPVTAADPFEWAASEPLVSVTGRVRGWAPEPPGSVADPTRGPAVEHVAGTAAATGGGLDAATLAEPWPGLSVLPLAGLADGEPEPAPELWVVEHVLEVARTAYRVVVVDLPATGGPAVAMALSRADALVAVGRCETAGVRGLQAAIEAWTASGHDLDTAGAVVTGVRPRAPLAPREVRAALGDRLWGLIPTAAAELAAAAEDGTLLLDRHDLSAVQAMVTLANRVVPFAAVST
jgi:cellulose biosynthesis protein BcsQ